MMRLWWPLAAVATLKGIRQLRAARDPSRLRIAPSKALPMSSLVEYDANLPVELDSAAAAGDGTGGGPQTSLLALAWRARWLILLTALLGVGAGWAWLQRVEPLYTSVSSLYIERHMPKILGRDAQFGQSASFLYTQAALIRSTPVLATVASAPENAELETFREVDGRVGFLSKKLNVDVGQADDIINVSIELPSAEDAAQLVNSVVNAYISKYAEQRRTNTAEVLDIIRNEKQRREADLEQRLGAIAEFRGKNAALAVQVGKENVITKRFAELAMALDRTELELLDAKTLYQRAQQMFETPSLRPFLLEQASAKSTVAQEMHMQNQLELGIENQIQDVELSINSLRVTWGDGHPSVKLLLESREKMEQRLTDKQAAFEERKTAIVTAYVETASQQYQLVEQKRAELQRNYDTQFQLAMQVNSKAVQLATLEEAAARTARQVDILDDRIKELNLTEDVGAMNLSVMEVAVVSPLPSYPNKKRFLGLGTLLGGLTGFGLASLRDLLDKRLKSTEEIARTLRLPVLGALPLAAGRLSRAQVGTIMVLQPQAMISEAFRSLRTSIHFGASSNESKVIAVTSALSEEGKSVVASNMAIALAQLGRRVLLVDADLRRPCQHEIFAVEPESGLSSVLAERKPVADVIIGTSVSHLDLLPSGPGVSNPVELLNNGYFNDLLDDLGSTYDRIVIDTPAVLPVADARIIAALSDSVLLVLYAERSTSKDSLAARDQLLQVGARQIGVVVNRVPGNKQSAYGHGYGTLGYYDEYTPNKGGPVREQAVIAVEKPVGL
jgi:succinoglycan biosynthesis transport protein ExoP